jgi:hypothetical protein
VQAEVNRTYRGMQGGRRVHTCSAAFRDRSFVVSSLAVSYALRTPLLEALDWMSNMKPTCEGWD